MGASITSSPLRSFPTSDTFTWSMTPTSAASMPPTATKSGVRPHWPIAPASRGTMGTAGRAPHRQRATGLYIRRPRQADPGGGCRRRATKRSAAPFSSRRPPEQAGKVRSLGLTPAYANRHVFARNDKELVCASLAANQPVPQRPEEVNTIQLRARETVPARHVSAPVVFSPDGTMLAVCALRDIRLLDVNKKRRTSDTSRATRITSYHVAFSPDGKTLVTARLDDTVTLWDLNLVK